MGSKIRNIILFLIVGWLVSGAVDAWPRASAQGSPPVLAFYYAWFDQNTWSSGQPADLPAELYNSADRATIERHLAQARSAGIDALVQSWYGPSENPTETNFRTLLDVAQAAGLKAAVDFEVTGPFFGDSGAVSGALATLLATHTRHPAYFRYQDKPVIFFWRQQRFSVEEWRAIRNQVDPERQTYWIAEGTDLAYQAVFDGHHLYSIAWAASPADQLQKWAERVRSYAADNATERLWVATVMPGYDDTRLGRADGFAVSRRDGDYYRETWQGALSSRPDLLIITSFNEWLEGTQIEPSVTYGNLYLDVTRELVTALRGSPPPEPVPLAAVQEAAAASPEATPAGPAVKVEQVTNVRSGPATDFARVGQLPAGGIVPVIGQTAAGDWWQIEFPPAPDGLGWVAAEVVEFVGEAETVPVVEAPAPAVLPATPAQGTARPTPTAVEEARITVPAGGTNVRSGPGLDFDLLGRLEEGRTAPVLARDETGEWWQIEYSRGQDGLGWVADAVVDFSGDRNNVPLGSAGGGLVEATPTMTPTPTPTEPVIAGRIEARDALNVRAEPALDGTLIGGLYLGDTADVLAMSEDGQWWQIDFPDGPDGTGWVTAEFVRFTGDKNRVPIFGLGTPTPTPGPTDTPTPTSPAPSPTPMGLPTFAPTATSVYQPTAAALLKERGTPDPTVVERPLTRRSTFEWGAIPWGIASLVVVVGFLWYQLSRRRRR